MFLFQKRLMELSQSSHKSNKLKSSYYSQSKEKQDMQNKERDHHQPMNLLQKFNQTINHQPIINKQIKKDDDQTYVWHKKSVTMKMKNASFKNGKKIVSGQMVKYKKGKEIYSFRCIKDTIKYNQLKQTKQDHDIETDDEQVYVASKKLFSSLCQSLKQEIFVSQVQTPITTDIIDNDFI